MWVFMDLENEARSSTNEDEDVYLQNADFFANGYVMYQLDWLQKYPCLSTLSYVQALCNIHL